MTEATNSSETSVSFCHTTGQHPGRRLSYFRICFIRFLFLFLPSLIYFFLSLFDFSFIPSFCVSFQFFFFAVLMMPLRKARDKCEMQCNLTLTTRTFTPSLCPYKALGRCVNLPPFKCVLHIYVRSVRFSTSGIYQ